MLLYALRSGLVLGLCLVLYGLVFRLADLHFASFWSWGFYFALPIGSAVAFYRVQWPLSGWRSMLSSLLALVVVASGLYASFVFAYNAWVDDSLLVDVLEASRSRLEASGLEGEALEAEMRRQAGFLSPAPFAVIVFVQLVLFGMVSGLPVVAWIRSRYRNSTIGLK